MNTAHLICFGLGGHGVYTAGTWSDGTPTTSHISGYDTPESFERALARGEKAEYPPLSGVPVLDKRELLRKKPSLSISSPLVDVKLKDEEIQRIDTRAGRDMLPGLSGGFELLAAKAIAHEGSPEPGPLDSISLPAYLRWWTSRGAHLGHMDQTGTRIVWQDQPEPLP